MTFGTAAAYNLDFASLATEDSTAFTKKSDFRGFEGAGAKLFEVGCLTEGIKNTVMFFCFFFCPVLPFQASYHSINPLISKLSIVLHILTCGLLGKQR